MRRPRPRPRPRPWRFDRRGARGPALAQTPNPGPLVVTAAAALGPDVAGSLPEVLGRPGIAGAAVYDAIVGLATLEHGADLATRDARAKATYDTVGVRVIVAE